MRTKRICCRGLIGLMLVASLCVNAWAAPPETFDLIETRATGTFTVRIDPDSTTRATYSTPGPMEFEFIRSDLQPTR